MVVVDIENAIDFVLVYGGKESGGKGYSAQEKAELRDGFIEYLQSEGKLEVVGKPVIETDGENLTFVLVRAPFEALCKEAERIRLKLPLAIAAMPVELNSCGDGLSQQLSTEDVDNYYAEPFEWVNRESFRDFNEPGKFFRQATRSLLTYNILVNLNLPRGPEEESHKVQKDGSLLESDENNHRGLKFLLHKGVFKDAFNLHDRPSTAAVFETGKNGEATEREILYAKWTAPFRYLPYRNIRNYLGERAGFYWALHALVISSLIVPMILGLGVFGYGVYRSVYDPYNATSKAITVKGGGNSTGPATWNVYGLASLTSLVDNDLTPIYAFIICLWGTAIVEYITRQGKRLSQEWNVDSYEEDEKDKPEFIGRTVKSPIDPELTIRQYPGGLKLLRILFSAFVYGNIIILITTVTLSCALLRVYMSLNYCPSASPTGCFILSVLLPVVLQVIFIIVLSKINVHLAKFIASFENHQTQSHYNQSIIAKMFVADFLNHYVPCFYAAVHVPHLQTASGIFGLGPQYIDRCDDHNCLSMISLQLIVFFLMQPTFKFFTGFLFPWLRRRHQENAAATREGFIEQQYKLPQLCPFPEDICVTEYVDTSIWVGFVMIFAAPLPLAPLLAIIALSIALRTGAYRVLYASRRNIPFIAKSIELWWIMIDYHWYVAVLFNGYVVGYSSRFGDSLDPLNKPWAVIIFVFLNVYIRWWLAWAIPDVPAKTKLQTQRENYYVRKYQSERLKKLYAAAGEKTE